MLEPSARTDTMFKGILHQFLFKAILLALLALILYGVFRGSTLAIILMLFVGSRFISLVAEALRKPASAERLETMLGLLTRRYENFKPQGRAAIAAALKVDPRLSARELAQAQIDKAVHRFVPARSKRELGAEALGVIAFAVLIPLDIALYTRDFFSLRNPQGWEGAIVAALCLALYAWPHRWLKSSEYSEFRIGWWVLPFAVAFVLLNHAIETRHRYLNPFNPDHNRLAAERVLALKNNVVAGRNAIWVLRYARQLDERGDSQQAIHFYREALRLDANNRAAYARLAALEAQSSGEPTGNAAQPAISPSAPYWTADKPVTPSPRRGTDFLQLANVEGCTVVIVPVGEVSDEILDAAGFVIHNELDLPVYISTNSVPLPPHTRVRGLVTGPQWDQAAIAQSFFNADRPFPHAPIKYVLITPVDIYMQEANYVYSVSPNWGAVVSLARCGGPTGNDPRLRERVAKQALCALLLSFGVPKSLDRNDVTCFTMTPEEFDAKGNYPNAETLKLFQQTLADQNREWQEHKAPPPVTK